jgi:hypothetical protein
MLLKIFVLDIIYVYNLTRQEDKKILFEKISYTLVYELSLKGRIVELKHRLISNEY